MNYWLTAVTRREYGRSRHHAYRDTNTSVYGVLVGSATASLLSKVTAVSQQLKHSGLGRVFRHIKEYLWLTESTVILRRKATRDLILLNTGHSMLAEQLLAGDRRALAKGITLVESTRADHGEQAVQLLAELMPHTGKSIRIGVSGAPGVGKSTFIESLGNYLTGQGHQVAVLAVDPTSAVSGGSILGDKTRMEALSVNPKAFVRPSPAGTTLGGVTRRTRESLLLCEAAGYDVIIVETVGVGQSETAVSDMTDMFLLLLSPGGGDDLQGIKRGIMELADLVLVNKADGDQANLVNQTLSDYRGALQFMQARTPGWTPKVNSCSALEGQGIAQAWAVVEDFRAVLTESGELEGLRARQAKAWMWAETAAELLADLRNHPAVSSLVPELEAAVLAGELPAIVAAQRLIETYKTGQ